MTTSGRAIFFDGMTSVRREVTVELEPQALGIRGRDGTVLAEWSYDQLEKLSAPDGVLRLGKDGNSVLARLEVHDPQLAAAIDDLSLPIDRSGRNERRMQTKVIVWSLTATARSFLSRSGACRGSPPSSRRSFPTRSSASSGRQSKGRCARAWTPATPTPLSNVEMPPARRKAARRSTSSCVRSKQQPLPIPLDAVVVRQPENNAITLPGGYIYVFRGLLDKAETPDELAGVIAHEVGHVANRDGTRAVMQAAGLSLLFGMLLGDFGGGSAVVVAARTVLQSS